MKTTTLYICEVCGAQFADKKMAERCEKGHKIPKKVKNQRYNPITLNEKGYPITVDIEFSDGTVRRYKE